MTRPRCPRCGKTLPKRKPGCGRPRLRCVPCAKDANREKTREWQAAHPQPTKGLGKGYKTPEVVAKAMARAKMVMEMRAKRMTWKAIGEHLGVSKQRALQIFQLAQKKFQISS